MATETRGGLPNGYTWQDVPELRATFPKPDGWYYRFESVSDTLSCFITKEQISATEPVVLDVNDTQANQALIREVEEGRGFRTGLQIQCMTRIRSKSVKGIVGNSPDNLARSAISNNPLFIPDGTIQQYKDGALTVYRGTFKSGSRQLASLGMPPIHHYMLTAGNNKTDKLYIINFETPEEFWERDKKVAEVMINNTRINKRF